MILDRLDIGPDRFAAATGWEIKPEGACKADICVPLQGAATRFDVAVVAQKLGMPLLYEPQHGVWALGPDTVGGRALSSAEAPELTLPDLEGREFRLSSLRGRKVVLVSWAPYCGCRMDLPGWQSLHQELEGQALTVVTVGLEMGGSDVVRPFVEDAHATHPSLVDERHVMDELFGVTSIPSWIWINEAGTIVRPPERAIPPAVMRPGKDGRPEAYGMGALVPESEQFADWLRDWAINGADSVYVLSPEKVIARSAARPIEAAEAAAHFEMAQYLWRTDQFSERTLHHFERAHLLQPDNLTYKRQAYSAYRHGLTPDDPAARLNQSQQEGEDWPFVSDFSKDKVMLARRNEASAKVDGARH